MSRGKSHDGGFEVPSRPAPEPELLDSLPPDDRQALRSRRDLRRVNAWLGSARILARCIAAVGRRESASRMADLGGGDGAVMLEVARRLNGAWREVELELVDRQLLLGVKEVTGFFDFGWKARAVAEDAFEWVRQTAPVDLITCNLFLHHFDNVRLARLLRLVSGVTSRFVACEPRRFAFPQAAGLLVTLIGCNSVTRHDAIASVRAGFRGKELSQLWPGEGRWQLTESDAGLFSHTFTAVQR